METVETQEQKEDNLATLDTTLVETTGEDVEKKEERPTMMIAKTPDEMVTAQKHLIEFMQEKVAHEQKELKIKEDNLEAAYKAKIRTAGWKREVAVAEKRVRYYTNVLAALKEGYCIIPDFPIGLIAIRTDKTYPKHQDIKRWGYYGIDDEKAKELTIGLGRYVAPEPNTYSTQRDVADEKGNRKKEERLITDGFKEVDFPLHLVKPQIIGELDRAMTLKLFDEIGVLPSEGANKRVKQDPMIIGRIIRKEGTKRRVASFLITWWIDPETI